MKGLYEIRLESIGGLGANLAGKILGEAGAYYMNKYAQSFASYGSEKRGSPVKAYIRYSDNPIRISSPVRNPNLLGIFTIGVAGKENVIAGINKETAVVVNSPYEAENTRDRLALYTGRLFVIDALKISAENKTRVNMVMLGAMTAASGKIDPDGVKHVIKDTIGKKYPEFLESNLRGFNLGYESAEEYQVPMDDKYQKIEYEEVKRAWGWDNAPIGGVNPVWGSTVTNRLESSRESYIPVFYKEKCINCGLCDSTCPDMVFQFVSGEYKGKPSPVNLGIDYYHCKGCLRCVEICPTNALTAETERDFDTDKMNIGSIYLLNKDFVFDNTGANSIVTGESTVRSEEE